MTLSPDQAADSLRQIERTQTRSAEVRSYAHASPGFILWGVMWAIGYANTALLLHYGHGGQAGILWAGIAGTGLMGSYAIGWALHRGEPRNPAMGWRWFGSYLALFAFTAATMLVLRPANPAALGVFVPLIVATVYAIFGIWQGTRFLYAGILVAAATLGGFFFLPHYFLLWMAAVGGGTLILTGLWLRRV